MRELDYHDTYLAEEYSHPGDNIPPLLAVAQQMDRSGADMVRGLATAYEIHINLVKAISLHKHKIDHVAHLGPAAAAGIGTMLGLSKEVIYQAINHALHVTTSTRQSRKGQISSWKAYAPGHATKLAVEAVEQPKLLLLRGTFQMPRRVEIENTWGNRPNHRPLIDGG